MDSLTIVGETIKNRSFLPILVVYAMIIGLQALPVCAQIRPRSVVSLRAGTGQSSGQEPEFFPANVLTGPSVDASRQTPESRPEHVCSLGLGGEIVLDFGDSRIIDGQGPDFVVFENAFFSPLINRVFAEPAVVSVSQDGQNWTAFPCDLRSLDGCAGTEPTIGGEADKDVRQAGGNQFDLARVGISEARYVRLVDVSNIIVSDRTHPFYDPTITGFDLDVVVGLNYAKSQQKTFQARALGTSGVVQVERIEEGTELVVIDASGRLRGTSVVNRSGPQELHFDLLSGAYILIARHGGHVIGSMKFVAL